MSSTRTIEQIVAAVTHYAPAAAPAIFKMLDIDLGPVPPDVRAIAASQDADAAAHLAARRAREASDADELERLKEALRPKRYDHDTDPAFAPPTSRSSGR